MRKTLVSLIGPAVWASIAAAVLITGADRACAAPADVPGQPAAEAQSAPPAGPDAAQPEARSAEVTLNKDYFAGYLTDAGNILTAPSRWEKSDWITASVITAAAVGLYYSDEKIKTWVQRNKTTTTKDIVKYAKRTASFTLPALAGWYLYGSLADNGKAKEAVLLSVESFVVTGVFVQTLKFAAHRHRPDTGDPYNIWDGPSLNTESGRSSFPSGDASSAFAVASVIASEYEDTAVVPSVVYGLASLIALGRVHENAHWSSDVFVGSAIGYFTGKAIYRAHAKGGRERVSLVPTWDGKNAGLLMSCRF